MNPACETCKADKPEQSLPKVNATGCTSSYVVMTTCMEKHGGNISSCREEWEAFRKCHQQSKVMTERG